MRPTYETTKRTAKGSHYTRRGLRRSATAMPRARRRRLAPRVRGLAVHAEALARWLLGLRMIAKYFFCTFFCNQLINLQIPNYFSS